MAGRQLLPHYFANPLKLPDAQKLWDIVTNKHEETIQLNKINQKCCNKITDTCDSAHIDSTTRTISFDSSLCEWNTDKNKCFCGIKERWSLSQPTGTLKCGLDYLDRIPLIKWSY